MSGRIEGITSDEALAGLATLRSEGLLCDIELEVDGKRLSAHRALLAAISPYFKKLFTGNFKEANQNVITLHGLTFESLNSIIDCFYTPGLDISSENLSGILAAANLLQISNIVSQCHQFMKDKMSVTTCFPFLRLAEKYDFEDIRVQANDFVLPNFLKLCHTSDFKELSKDALVYYISHDKLNRGLDESQVFYAVKEWLEHDPERLEFTEEVLNHVRFMTIPLDKLNEIADTELIDERKDCRMLIRKALTYHAKIFEQPLCNELQNKPRGEEGFFIVQNDSEPGWKNHGDTECFMKSNKMSCNIWSVAKRANQFRSKLDVTLVKFSMSAVQLNNFLYLFAADTKTFQPITLRYNATTAERLKLAPIPRQATAGSCAAIMRGCIYLLSGLYVEKSSEYPVCKVDLSKKAFQYKIASNEWVKLANVPKPAFASASSESHEHNCIYMSGGCTGISKTSLETTTTPSLSAYDTEANLWLSKPNMQYARAEHVMEAFDGNLYVLGGRINCSPSGPYVTQIEKYDIIMEQWTVLNNESLSSKKGISLKRDKTIFILGGVTTHDYDHLNLTTFDITTQMVKKHLTDLHDTKPADDCICGLLILPQLL